MTANTIIPTRRVWRQSALALVLVGGGFALGAASLAAAHGDMPEGMGGWHHHHHGPRVGMIQHFTRRALDDVGATTAQEDKVHDIIASAYTELQKDGSEHGAMRKQVLELMKAPTLDKAAFEKLRAQKVADMDAKSKVVSNALFDAASQLTPEQRAKLAEKIEARSEHGHGGWGGWHHHDRMDGPDGGSKGDHGPESDHG